MMRLQKHGLLVAALASVAFLACVKGEQTSRSADSTARNLTLAPNRPTGWSRSEEHTSELQSHSDLVCRLLLEKKKKIYYVPCSMTHLFKSDYTLQIVKK